MDNENPVNEQRLFEEYRELSFSWRADDERLSKLTPVLVPVSFAAFAVNGSSSHILIIGGLILMIYWCLAAHITVKKIDVRCDRMREIEEILGFDAHRRYKRLRNQQGVLKDAYIRWGLTALYAVAVIIKLFYALIVCLKQSNFCGLFSVLTASQNTL